ncbi:carbohydrate kinase [Streptomyces sp. NA02950]|uniref:FGGY-family carbohydrate kinase n=1 Tax=Streptomyces sp. NA02950 TaxID=2742137 RepID=UPI00159288DE|nr:FGGY family carbohydrate kinase [Streptomyces sp. NA02950]QKV92643.1 carbohydrate kinase [Streptomyces sp. NA02950]
MHDVLGEVVAGIDIATAAVRVLCVDADGRVRAEGRAALPTPHRGPGGHSEQPAGSWWPAVASALRQATGALPAGGREVVAVATSATSGTIVPVDGAGEPTGPALMYDDRRAAALNARAQELGADRWRALGLSVGPTAALGRIAWLADDSGRGSGRTRHIRHTPDLIGHRLTGAPVATDWSHALKSGYDPREGGWPDEVLGALGVPGGWLPPVQAPATAVGTVCPEAAAETGLPAGCAVRLGMTDGCAGQLATGAVRPGQFAGILGTTYVLKGVTRELVTDPSGALYSHRHPDGWWLPGGASNTGGEALARVPADRLPALDRAAADRGPASVIAYPLRREGERFPFVSGAARGFVHGTPDDDADRHRAALEGVAFLERLALDRVRELGVAVEGPLWAAGGGSRSPLWTRIRATVLGRPLRVADHAETAFGAALLAASGTLHPDLATAAAAMVRTGRDIEPHQKERGALEDSYAAFTAALRDRGWLG